MKATISLRKDKRGEWRIHIKDARNGKVLFASSEGYRSRAMAQRNLDRLRRILLLASISYWSPRGDWKFEVPA